MADGGGLGLGEVVLLVLALTIVAVVLQPFQLAMMRMLEGTGPWLPFSSLLLRGQKRRRNRLREDAALSGPAPAEEEIQRAGEKGHELRRRFPAPDHLLRPTALGNALTAMEDGAGRHYGADAVVAWPRLYPLLGERVRELVDDRRDGLDLAARMAVTLAVTAVATGSCCWARAGGGRWRSSRRRWPGCPTGAPCTPPSRTPRPSRWRSTCTARNCSARCA